MSSSALRNRVQGNPNAVVPIQYSLSDTLREMTYQITDANQQAVDSILHALEHDKHLRKSQKLFPLIKDYFSNSFLMSELCNALEDCLRSARNRELILCTAVGLFNEEKETANGVHRYVRALQELKRFQKAENPFPLFSQVLYNVFLKQKALADKLNCRDEKKKYCLLRIKAWKMFSRIICLLVHFDLMILRVMGPLGGQSQCASSFSYSNRLKWEFELTSTMKECAFVKLNDLKEICSAVEQLENQLKSLLQNANFALGGQETAVKLRFTEIESNMGRFTETLDELGKSARMCSQDLQKGRLLIKNKIEHIELNCQIGGSTSKKADSYEDDKKSYREPPSQGEMISSVIESNEGIRNYQELYDLVNQFFSHSISKSAFCNEIESCVNKARDSQLKLHAAVQIFKEGRGDGAIGRNKYKRSLAELEKFMNSKYPFIGLPEKLEMVPQQQDNKLKLYENKIKKKMLKTMIRRIAIAFIFMSLIASIISCQADLDSTGLVLMVPKVGLVTAVKVSAIISGWIVLQSVCKKYYEELKRQQDLIGLMKKHGLIEIKNFDQTRMAAEKVVNLVLQLKENAKFTLEGEEKVKIGFEDIEKKMDKFAKFIENMAECVEKCSEDLKKGREEIITKIRAAYI